jgi:hypothetical protein
MWGGLLLNIICIAALITWAVELIWLYREATLEGKDAISLVSGAAVFFVLAAPVAIYRPDLVYRLSEFWERVLRLDQYQPNRQAPVARLICDGQVFPLTRVQTRIGNYRNNDIVLDHPTLSAYHVEITLRSDGRHEVVDRNTRNGTRVNGSLIRTAVLRDGDQLMLGAISLHYLRSSSVERAFQNGGLPISRRKAS